MEFFSWHNLVSNFFSYRDVRHVVAAALICLAATVVSCRSAKEIEYVTVTERVHDSIEVVKYIHDTTQVVEVKHDSVDRYVEKTVFIDKDGVVHEREIERLTKVIKESSEEYKAKEMEYVNRISELEKQISEKSTDKEVVVENSTAWWQRTLMFFGALLLAGSLIFVFFLAIKTRRG